MSDAPTPPLPEACSFCRKPRAEVVRLVAAPEAAICDACVALASQILVEADPSNDPIVLPVAQVRPDLRSPAWRRWLRRVF